MRAKRPHVLITESNKSEQPDSNHDKLFIDVSKQSDELFQYQGNTSSDDQYKNQQLDTETVSQQGLYSVPSADMEQTFQTGMPPAIPTSTTIPQQNLYNMPQQYSFNNAFQPVLLPQNMVQPAISNSNTLQQRGEQKQTYHHTYCPVIMEDFNACVTYVAQVNSSADSRFSMSRETLSSMIYKHELKTNTTEISDIQDYRQSVRSRNENYAAFAKNNSVDGNVFSCLMMAYDEIVKQYRSVEQLVPREEMQEYLFTMIQKSERSYNGGSIVEEFQEKLNTMLLSQELELVENSCLNQCYGTSGTVPILYHDGNWLYFPSESFEYLAPKITLANCVGNVRKALKEKGWLRMSETMRACVHRRFKSVAA